MRYMHTKLPEFYSRIKNAALKHKSIKEVEIKGLENLRTAKMQSLRTARVEDAVAELAQCENVEKIEVILIPRVPETMHTVIIKAAGKDGSLPKAVLETMNILHGTEELYLEDCAEVEDRRPPIKGA